MNNREEKYLFEYELLIPDIDYDLINYRSPIELILTQIQMQMHDKDHIMKSIVKVGINVDKEELLKALQYDREQYDKGYNDGILKCRQELVDIIKENDLYIPTRLVNKLLTVGIIK